jgi:hypothetical protein
MMLDAAGGGLTLEHNPASRGDPSTEQQAGDDDEVPLPDYFQFVTRLLLAAPTATELPLHAGLRAGGSSSGNKKPELTRSGKVIEALLVLYPLCYALFAVGLGDVSLSFAGALISGNTTSALVNAGLTVWFLAGGVPAFSALCVVLGPDGHLVRLGGATARLPAAAVSGLNRWRRVIRGAWAFLSLTFGLTCALFGFLNSLHFPTIMMGNIIVVLPWAMASAACAGGLRVLSRKVRIWRTA